MKVFQLINSKSIKTAAISSLLIKFLSTLFTFLTSVILARSLGLNQFGVYTLILTTILLLTIPVSFGIPSLLIRFISKYDALNDKNSIKGLIIRSNQFLVISTAFIWLLFLSIYVIFFKNNYSFSYSIIINSLLIIPIITFSSFKSSILKGLKYVFLGQLTDNFFRSSIFLVGIAIFNFYRNNITPSNVIFIYLISAFIAMTIATLIVYFKFSKKIRNCKSNFKTKYWFKELLPFSINEGVQVFRNKAITYIIAIFSSVESVAVFDIALRGSSLVAFTLNALNSAIAPFVSSTYENKDWKNLQNILTKTSRIIFILAIPIVLVFLFGGKELIDWLFGKEYVDAYIPLLILCFGQLVNAFTGSVGLLLAMTGKQKIYTSIFLIITILNVILSVFFVVFYGVIGAAVVSSSLLAIQNLYLAYYVKNKLNFNTTIF